MRRDEGDSNDVSSCICRGSMKSKSGIGVYDQVTGKFSRCRWPSLPVTPGNYTWVSGWKRLSDGFPQDELLSVMIQKVGSNFPGGVLGIGSLRMAIKMFPSCV